jgi:rhamnogalacturonan endolyase
VRVPTTSDSGAVRLTEDERFFCLHNGTLAIRVDKRSGRLVNLGYRDLDLLGRRARCSATKGGYWSVTGSVLRLSKQIASSVVVDPKDNGGERAIVSVRAVYDGEPGTLPLDLDCRFALERAQSALFIYSIWRHNAGYPGFAMSGDGRFVLKLNPEIFDFLTVDKNRRRVMPTSFDWNNGSETNLKEARRLTTGRYAGEVEHKYDYSAVLYDAPAYGWSSSERKIGVWIINPSIEYVAGGPSKVELTGHLDSDSTAYPTLLNVWKGSHYGGSSLVLARDEAWSKVVGPYAVYCNSGCDHDSLWIDALSRAEAERRSWPYCWATDPAYPARAQRGGAAGRVVLQDPIVSQATIGRMLVGLAAPGYPAPDTRGNEEIVDWQLDGKYYQYWSKAGPDGRFSIENVRPGAYALHAFADGVLGEFVRHPVVVDAGRISVLGDMVWRPVRYGRQIWEIGTPDRTAGKFRHGDHYWRWGLYNRYPAEFPSDVRFVVGKSEWNVDWNYVQPPKVGNRGICATTWTICFDLPEPLTGRATLRIAVAGSRTPRGVEVGVNGHPVGSTGPLPNTGVMHRDGIRGRWCERKVEFDAALLEAGTNAITLTVPAKHWAQGILYDYLRLEHSADQLG